MKFGNIVAIYVFLDGGIDSYKLGGTCKGRKIEKIVDNSLESNDGHIWSCYRLADSEDNCLIQLENVRCRVDYDVAGN